MMPLLLGTSPQMDCSAILATRTKHPCKYLQEAGASDSQWTCDKASTREWLEPLAGNAFPGLVQVQRPCDLFIPVSTSCLKSAGHRVTHWVMPSLTGSLARDVLTVPYVGSVNYLSGTTGTRPPSRILAGKEVILMTRLSELLAWQRQIRQPGYRNHCSHTQHLRQQC